MDMLTTVSRFRLRRAILPFWALCAVLLLTSCVGGGGEDEEVVKDTRVTVDEQQEAVLPEEGEENEDDEEEADEEETVDEGPGAKHLTEEELKQKKAAFQKTRDAMREKQRQARQTSGKTAPTEFINGTVLGVGGQVDDIYPTRLSWKDGVVVRFKNAEFHGTFPVFDFDNADLACQELDLEYENTALGPKIVRLKAWGDAIFITERGYQIRDALLRIDFEKNALAPLVIRLAVEEPPR